VLFGLVHVVASETIVKGRSNTKSPQLTPARHVSQGTNVIMKKATKLLVIGSEYNLT